MTPEMHRPDVVPDCPLPPNCYRAPISRPRRRRQARIYRDGPRRGPVIWRPLREPGLHCAITEVGSATANGASGTAISVTHGLTILTSDVVVAWVHTNAVGTITDNNGASAFTSRRHEELTAISAYSVFDRVAGGSEPAAYAFTGSASNRWSIQVRVFRGVDATIWDVAPPAASTGSSATATAATQTTLTDDAQAIYFALADSATATFSAPTNSFITEVEPAAQQAQVTYVKAIAAHGAIGSTASTISGSNDWAASLSALKPAAGLSAAQEIPAMYQLASGTTIGRVDV